MATTLKQIEANRRNAAKSTGPRTADGKAASRGNAMKHGVLSAVVVAENEDRDAFDTLCQGLFSEFQPQTMVEIALVEKLAVLFWRGSGGPARSSADSKMSRHPPCPPPNTELRTRLRDRTSKCRSRRLPRVFDPAAPGQRTVRDQPHRPDLSGRRPGGADASCAATRCANAGADRRQGGYKCPVICIFRIPSTRLRPAAPNLETRRRRDARSPGVDPRHRDLRQGHGARTDIADQASRQARNDCIGQRNQVYR